MANKWVEFVRKWSKDHNVSYMCASSMPECKAEYKSGKAPKNTQKANREQMGAEDVRSAKKGAEVLKEIKEAKKMGIEDIKSALLRRAQGIVQPLQTADTAVVKPKGRPKKYATAEEAKRMKSVKTVEARKAKKAKEAEPVVVPMAPTGARGDDLIHYSPKLSLTKSREELRQIYNKSYYYSLLLNDVDWYDAFNGLNASKKSVDKALSVSKKIKEMIKGVLTDAFGFRDFYLLDDFEVAKINNPYFRKVSRTRDQLTADDLASIGIIEKGDGWVFKVKIFNKKVEEIEEELKSDEDRIRMIRASGAGYESSDSDMSEVSDDEIISRINKKGKVVHLKTRDDIMRGGRHSDDVDNYSMIINHLVEHISDPSEPVDPRDYDQAIHFIREMRRAKGGAELYSREYGGAYTPVNSGNQFLDVIAQTGHELGQSHPGGKILNPFDLGEKLGEKLGNAMMKTKLGNPKTGIFSKHFWTPKKRHH